MVNDTHQPESERQTTWSRSLVGLGLISAIVVVLLVLIGLYTRGAFRGAPATPATLFINGTHPTPPVSKAGTYSYTLQIVSVAASPEGCGSFTPCVLTAADCSQGSPFRLSSDTGANDFLTGTAGQVYLSTGNWTGATVSPLSGNQYQVNGCAWSLRLTATTG